MYFGQWNSLVAMGAIMTVVVGAGMIPLLAPPATSVGAPSVSQTVVPAYYENLVIAGGGFPPVYSYTPPTLAAPSMSRLVFTIVNTDPRVGSLPNPTFAMVTGTVGEVMQVTVGTSTFVTHQLPVKGVSHTFTIQMGAVNVNVPIPPMMGGIPTIVTFTLFIPIQGVYPFNCAVLYYPPSTGMHGTLVIH